ncbi:MAG: hypothetical protein ABIN74_01440 [Ferruginibacter sp.]
MKQYIFQFIVVASLLVQPAKAQQFNQLDSLKDNTFKVYYSAGHQQRTAAIAKRVDNAMSYYTRMMGLNPSITLLILDTADWRKYAPSAVYGMPHYKSDKILVVAAEDNPFWKSFIPPVDQLPKDLRMQVESAYRDKQGKLSMQPFFDLLAIHELGHAFHLQGGLNMQRNWMGELFVNILLHTYIAENEPGLLPALTIFPQMVIAGGSAGLKYTSLNDVHEKYNEIGQHYPKNYGWYQCRWHAAAAGIYDAGGKLVGRKLWDTLKNQKEKLTDEQLLVLLEAADKTVADVMRNWDRDMVK